VQEASRTPAQRRVRTDEFSRFRLNLCEYARNIDPTAEGAQRIDMTIKKKNGMGSCFARNVTPSRKLIHLCNQRDALLSGGVTLGSDFTPGSLHGDGIRSSYLHSKRHVAYERLDLETGESSVVI
jgi:hypothetical protein